MVFYKFFCFDELVLEWCFTSGASFRVVVDGQAEAVFMKQMSTARWNRSNKSFTTCRLYLVDVNNPASSILIYFDSMSIVWDSSVVFTVYLNRLDVILTSLLFQ